MGMSRVWSKSDKDGPNSHVNEKGIGWIIGAVFIIGETAGGGMIALSYALTSMGLIPGLILLLLCATFSCYTALELSWTWKIMQNRWPDYRDHCRKPYGEMAYRTIGPKMRSFIAFMICITQIGFATVLVLLAAKNLSIILHFFFSVDINQCYLILIVGLAVWPATMLKSPMHFWQAAIFSAGSSTLAVILVIVGMVHDAPVCASDVPHEAPEVSKAFMAFGTFVFAYGGHATLPTIQHDMRKPAHFVHSILLAIAFCTALYMCIAVGGYFVYGDTVGEAIIPSLQVQWIQQTVNLMIAVHVITTIVIVMSPPIQQVEQILKVPHRFGLKRFLVRSVLFWFVIFIALSIPHFGPFLDLIGASTMVLMTLVLPPIFYLSIRTQELKWARESEKPDTADVTQERASLREVLHLTPKPILILNAAILIFGIIGGTLSTITSIVRLADSELAPPCYYQYFTKGLPFHGDNSGSVSCCGVYRNLTVSGQDPLGYCANPDF
uniref:Aa_trans domain-containing protein n=1 Tax=Caenorhabditis japonica TaxID=281687 RepID=A0A8R1DLV1_CAEJA